MEGERDWGRLRKVERKDGWERKRMEKGREQRNREVRRGRVREREPETERGRGKTAWRGREMGESSVRGIILSSTV